MTREGREESTPKATEDIIETSNTDARRADSDNVVGASAKSDPSTRSESTGNDAPTEDTATLETSSKDADWVEKHNGATESSKADGTVDAPPLPEEEVPSLPEGPPLPEEPLPEKDDGWEPVWEPIAQAYYFYNRFTQATQWTNPRVQDEAIPEMSGAPGTSASKIIRAEAPPSSRPAGGYDPSIHGDYDPTAWYAQTEEPESSTTVSGIPGDPSAMYAATGAFNRFTGRWQAADVTPENYNDENKSKRQMSAFFDVDAAANSHDGRSLKAERSGKKISRTELKQFKEKRKNKKEEKRRAWLLD